MVTKRFLKNVIVVIVSVFMSLVVVQGVQAEQTGLDYQSLHLLPFNGNKQLVLGFGSCDLRSYSAAGQG